MQHLYVVAVDAAVVSVYTALHGEVEGRSRWCQQRGGWHIAPRWSHQKV